MSESSAQLGEDSLRPRHGLEVECEGEEGAKHPPTVCLGHWDSGNC